MDFQIWCKASNIDKSGSFKDRSVLGGVIRVSRMSSVIDRRYVSCSRNMDNHENDCSSFDKGFLKFVYEHRGCREGVRLNCGDHRLLMRPPKTRRHHPGPDRQHSKSKVVFFYQDSACVYKTANNTLSCSPITKRRKGKEVLASKNHLTARTKDGGRRTRVGLRRGYKFDERLPVTYNRRKVHV